jgi:ribosomal protein S18 acetylase RimI-like enzyme
MITIRAIRESDIEGFHLAVDTVCRERKYLATFEAPALERTRNFVISNITEGYPQFVAEDEGRIVGWCDALPGAANSGSAHVGQLGMGVLKSHRDQGIGRRLLEATIEGARKLGLEKIELSVYARNTSAIGLYQKLGFEDEGLKRNGRLADGIHDDVRLMALHLA